MKYLIGLLVIATGTILVIKTEWFVNNFGRISWAEEHFGFEGGTRIFYKVLGVILIFFAFLAMIGVFNGLLTKTFGGVFKNSSQQQTSGDTLQ